ncbi:MAG: glutamine synthetase, partial [Bacillota bacterium]|nr:glutamine synthetase [Bacillota bacterium]
KDYLSALGYGSLMGILKNYELINPFVSSTTDAYKRLQPGYEAPVSIVASLGISPDTPSRNRTVLIDVIRDLEKLDATRFELRSPNPSTNSYLTFAACLQSMLDGCKYAVGKTQEELYAELSKHQGIEAGYLETNRRYISAHDVYEKYTEKVRNTIFGKHPTNVYEAIKIMNENEHKIGVLLDNQVFTRIIIESYKQIMTDFWLSELKNRIIVENEEIVRSCKKLHTDDYNEVSEQDVRRWQVIKNLRWELMKHHKGRPGVFDMLKIAIDDRDYLQISNLQNELAKKMKTLTYLYAEYKHKLL